MRDCTRMFKSEWMRKCEKEIEQTFKKECLRKTGKESER